MDSEITFNKSCISKAPTDRTHKMLEVFLTDLRVERKKVLAQNRGRTPWEIQSALYTLVDHLEEKHNCTFSTNSWCYFQKTLALKDEDASIVTPILRQPYLGST